MHRYGSQGTGYTVAADWRVELSPQVSNKLTVGLRSNWEVSSVVVHYSLLDVLAQLLEYTTVRERIRNGSLGE